MTDARGADRRRDRRETRGTAFPMREKTWARTSMPKRTTEWRSCCLSSESTGGIAMEKADLGCVPRKRLPRGAGSSSGTVDPRAVARIDRVGRGQDSVVANGTAGRVWGLTARVLFCNENGDFEELRVPVSWASRRTEVMCIPLRL